MPFKPLSRRTMKKLSRQLEGPMPSFWRTIKAGKSSSRGRFQSSCPSSKGTPTQFKDIRKEVQRQLMTKSNIGLRKFSPGDTVLVFGSSSSPFTLNGPRDAFSRRRNSEHLRRLISEQQNRDPSLVAESDSSQNQEEKARAREWVS